MTFKAPFLRYSDVGEYARNFLKEYHPSLKPPIPIEYIIEFDLELRIQPLLHMYTIFKQSGFLNRDRTVIYVDEYQYDNLWEKYRFTLAHEVGHFLMHENIYKDLPTFNSEEEFLDWLFSRPNDQVKWFENHADWFAAQVLVPSEPLNEHCIELLEANREIYSGAIFTPHEFWSDASHDLAESFQVNPLVMQIRLQQGDFISKFADYYHNH